jgi:hypothetical protein
MHTEIMALDPIPQARVVRAAGQLVAPPPAPRGVPHPLVENLRTVAEVAVGMWPLTGALLLMFALLFFAGNAGAP